MLSTIKNKIIVDCCRNHLGSSEIIKEMIHKAAINGADYVKFQIYNPDRLDRSWPNYTNKYLELKRHCLSDYQISEILLECKKENILPVFTLFSLDRLDFLKCVFEDEQISLKIASPDMSNESLLNGVIKHFPYCDLFISTGMHSIPEIKSVFLNYIDEFPKWFYCISHYPTCPEEINWELMKWYDGFSDHTLGIACAKKAIDNGMEFVEKHFTLSRNLPGTDQLISIEPDELKELTSYIKNKEMEVMYKRRWSNEPIFTNI